MLEYTAYEEASAALVAMNGRDMRHGIQLLTMEHLRIALLARLRAIEESGRDAALKWHGFARRTAGARYAQIAVHCLHTSHCFLLVSRGGWRGCPNREASAVALAAERPQSLSQEEPVGRIRISGPVAPKQSQCPRRVEKVVEC